MKDFFWGGVGRGIDSSNVGTFFGVRTFLEDLFVVVGLFLGHKFGPLSLMSSHEHLPRVMLTSWEVSLNSHHLVACLMC